MAVREDVYCTLVLTDAYLPGAAVLAKSLRDGGTTKKLACLVVQENLRHSTMLELQSLYNYTIPVSPISSSNVANLWLMRRPDLVQSFTKIHLWRMTQFRSIIYIDSDVVALRAPDELFDTKEPFAAASDVGFPDAFNTGVMVLRPDEGEYWALKNMAEAGDSFDGADQGLLNQYFEHRPWKRLSFTYNCTPNSNYQYEPAYRYYKRDITMVHFIGSQKPWQKGRSHGGTSGAYQELLSRWWAVYDRHFRVMSSDGGPSDRRRETLRTIQKEVKDESQTDDLDYYATGYPAQSTQPAPVPAPPPPTRSVSEARETTEEARTSEEHKRGHDTDKNDSQSQPKVEERPFSAPHMEWDATRDAPPAESRPEAANFPTEIYEFTSDPEQFRPPPSYPAPPKDMWYEVPKQRPHEDKLAPIFPWEEREHPTPSRRFIEDTPPPLPPRSEPEPHFAAADELEVSSNDTKPQGSPTTPIIKVNDEPSFQPFTAFNKNAWDDNAGIESYVRALSEHQRSRGNKQVARNKVSEATHVLSPTKEIDADELVKQVNKRRESLILTDFPTAIERPSLPVTPAPVRKGTFWGGERPEGADEDLVPAEGVVSQADWDPSASLEALRRSSLLGSTELSSPLAWKSLPDRRMPSTATAFRDESGSGSPTATRSGQVAFDDSQSQSSETTSARQTTFNEVRYDSSSRSQDDSQQVSEILPPKESAEKSSLTLHGPSSDNTSLSSDNIAASSGEGLFATSLNSKSSSSSETTKTSTTSESVAWSSSMGEVKTMDDLGGLKQKRMEEVD